MTNAQALPAIALDDVGFYALIFGAALVLGLVLTYLVRAFAWRAGLFDEPDQDRHRHDRPTPRIGGVAVYVAATAVIGLALLRVAGESEASRAYAESFIPLFAGAAGIFALGVRDDFRRLRARTKFLIECAVAAGVFYAGVRIGTIGVPGLGTVHLPAAISLAVTCLWLVGITNAFNLIDGSDGVAAGAAVFASVSIALVLILAGDTLGAALALALAGATLGFLFFNFPPASIFLGDGGSLFLGFSLASLGIISTQKAPIALAIAIPVVSFGLPILDTLLTVVRRFLRREPVFNADHGHIHHRLQELGHSPRMVALVLYAVCGGFALLALLLTRPSGSAIGLAFLMAGVVAWMSIQRLQIPELLELSRIVNRGMQQRHVIARNLRVRAAAVRLSRATEASTVIDALASAFDPAEFDRAELWVPDEYGGRFVGERGITPDGPGYLWSWHANGNMHRSALWEIRFPILDGSGDAIGRLSLWPSTAAEHLLTDVRLVAERLRPELQGALERLRRTALSATPARLLKAGAGARGEGARVDGHGRGSRENGHRAAGVEPR